MSLSANPSDWYCPEADDDGFVALTAIEKAASELTLDEFREAYPVPALLVVYRGEGDGEIVDPTDRGVQLLTVAIRSTAVLRYLGKVAFLAKRPGNPYAHLISIGRSAQNDLTVSVDSVSKVHGYFVAGAGEGDGEGWSFTDHGSTNGSRLDGAELASGEKYPLRDGSLLQLGLEVSFELLTPESLYRRAQR